MYLKPDELLAEASDLYYRRQVDPNAKMTDKMARMMLLIANNLITSRAFIKLNETVIKDDLISDAMCNIVQRAGRFNPEITKSAFAFFTQCIYFSFLNTLKRERKYMLTKMSALRMNVLELPFATLKEEFGEDFARAIIKDLQPPDTKRSVFLKEGGTLTARRNRFKRKPLSELFYRTLDSMWAMELWID